MDRSPHAAPLPPTGRADFAESVGPRRSVAGTAGVVVKSLAYLVGTELLYTLCILRCQSVDPYVEVFVGLASGTAALVISGSPGALSSPESLEAPVGAARIVPNPSATASVIEFVDAVVTDKAIVIR
jgi:hypothetical protein